MTSSRKGVSTQIDESLVYGPWSAMRRGNHARRGNRSRHAVPGATTLAVGKRMMGAQFRPD